MADTSPLRPTCSAQYTKAYLTLVGSLFKISGDFGLSRIHRWQDPEDRKYHGTDIGTSNPSRAQTECDSLHFHSMKIGHSYILHDREQSLEMTGVQAERARDHSMVPR